MGRVLVWAAQEALGVNVLDYSLPVAQMEVTDKRYDQTVVTTETGSDVQAVIERVWGDRVFVEKIDNFIYVFGTRTGERYRLGWVKAYGSTGQPMYEHDCDRCWFLGPYRLESGERADLYVCPEQGSKKIASVVARTSSDGPDYESGVAGAPQSPALSEALARADMKGFFVSSWYVRDTHPRP